MYIPVYTFLRNVIKKIPYKDFLKVSMYDFLSVLFNLPSYTSTVIRIINYGKNPC